MQSNWTCNHYANSSCIYFFLTSFCLVCASSPFFVRIDVSRFGRYCLGWSRYSFWPTPLVGNGEHFEVARNSLLFCLLLWLFFVIVFFFAKVYRPQNVAHRDSRESSINWLFVNVLFVAFEIWRNSKLCLLQKREFFSFYQEVHLP